MALGAYQGWLFDLDGVLTKTAEVHATAWKRAFYEFLDNEAERTNRTFAPFDLVADYGRYVDGEAREDGVRNFLAARDIELPEGTGDDRPDARTALGIADLFDVRFDGHVVKQCGLAGKPAPDSHLEGARALGVRALTAPWSSRTPSPASRPAGSGTSAW